MRRLPLLLLISACSFTSRPPASGDDPGVDAKVVAPTPDAPGLEPPRPLYAASNQLLYRLDLDATSATEVGEISDAGETVDLAGLAFDGTHLLGLTPSGVALIRIDPDDAKLVSKKNLTPVARWAGLTVVPAGELGAAPILFAGNVDDGQLFRIDPAGGLVTAVGPFGEGLGFFSDLAWVHGLGLIATLQGAGCTPVCFAKLDPSTGSATIVRDNAPNTLFGLSGYRGRLWALNGAGPVLEVDPSSWLMAVAFDPEIHWTEAAQ